MRAAVLVNWNEAVTRDMIVRFVQSCLSYYIGTLMIA